MDKPAGPTSHDVVARVRRALGTRAVGHTGTLDPFATGLLVVLVGRATRLARFVEAQPKTYLATARLGMRTTTDDLTGEPVGEPGPGTGIAAAAVQEALTSFLGVQQQRPPQFSAKRVAGERSYRLARRGEQVALADATVTVHRIDLVRYEAPLVTFRATVSAGTYVRALARDLGERLGVGAHLTALRRESIGDLRVEDAVPLDQVSPAALLPARRALTHLPAVELDEAGRRAVVHGRAVPGDPPGRSDEAADSAGAEPYAALLHGGDLVAVARIDDGWLRPTVVLEDA